MVGVINDYCENQNFNTIILANEEFFKMEMGIDDSTYHMLREKTVSQSIYSIPDYSSVVHSIISGRVWPSPDYAEYLAEHETLVLSAFISGDDITAKGILSKSGIYKDGELTIKVDDSDIKRLYPKYSPELITEAEREWIECGIWDSKKYVKEMAAIHGVK